MKRRDKKKIIIAAAIVSLIFMITAISIGVFSGRSTLEEVKVPGMEEFAEENVDLEVNAVMVEDEQTLFWDIPNPTNSTDIVVITGVGVLMTWSDDENAPAFRPMYENTPDTFVLSVVGIPLLTLAEQGMDNNSTNQTTTQGVVRVTSTSNFGSTRVDLDVLNNPILVKSAGNGSGNSTIQDSWNPDGSLEAGNTGLFINVTCIAGDIISTRPALLMYNDPGDEITMNIKVFYKIIPQEVLDGWLELNTRA